MVCSRYPKECRYYESVLKRKSFRKLRNNVWEKKTKWKLLEMADDHCRTKLLGRYFNFWTAYLQETLRTRINLQAADVLYEEKLKRKGMSGLRRNAVQCYMFLRICKKKLEWDLKFRTWHQWKHYTQKRVKVGQIKTLANKIRQERLLVGMLSLCSFRHKEKRSLQDAYDKAAAEHDRKLSQKYFQLWKTLTDKQMYKKEIQRLATACYEDKLKERAYRCWKTHTTQKAVYRNQTDVMQRFYSDNLIKTCLNRWLEVCEKINALREQCNSKTALDHSNRKLLEKGFAALVRVKEKKRKMEETTRRFEDRCAKICVSFYIRVWRERMCEKMTWKNLQTSAMEWRKFYLTELFLTKLTERYGEVKEEREREANAVRYSNAILTHRAFESWKQATARRINKRQQEQQATEFYLSKLSKAALAKWSRYMLMKSKKRTAEAYYKNVLILSVWDGWREYVIDRRVIVNKVEKLERKHEARLLLGAFKAWESAAVLSKVKNNIAVAYYNRVRLFKVFTAWRKHAQVESERMRRYNSNRNNLNSTTIKNTLKRWREMLSVKQTLKRKLEQVRGKHDRRILASRFNIWQTFVEKMKSIRQAVNSFQQASARILKEQYVLVLYEALQDKRLFYKKEALARVMEDRILKRKFMRKWMSFISWKKEKILMRLSQEKKYQDCCRTFGLPGPAERGARRRPIIPEYLKEEMNFEEFQDPNPARNDETFRVSEPVNKKLPVAGQKGTFVSFK